MSKKLSAKIFKNLGSQTFRNISIKARLIFVIGFLSAGLIGVGAIGMTGMAKTDQSLLSVYQDRMVPFGQIGEIRTLVLQNQLLIATSQLKALPTYSATSADQIERNVTQINAMWGKYAASNLTPKEKSLAIQFTEDTKKLVDEGLKPAAVALRANDMKEVKQIVVDSVQPYFVSVEDGINALGKLQLELAEAEYRNAVSRNTNIRNLSIVAIGLGELLAVIVGFFMVRAVVVPLNKAIAVADAVAAGDLTSHIEISSSNETGRLLQALKRMNENLVDLVGKVRTSADSISAGTQQISSGNADLSSRTEEQASSLEETASSMEELTSAVKHNTDNARQANQLAAGASEVAVKGGAVVGQVVTTMSSINDSSKKIADIIGVIDGIAFQTNILALNAAVEAARAGEQGRGFAVVATEVRTLAQRSAAAAKEIKQLISDSVHKVEDGTRLVDQAGKTMDEIVASVKRVTDVMAEIAAASQEQGSGIEQVNQAITQMDQTTQQNAALVEEAAAAAESMEEQAQNLAQAVAVFKLSQDEEFVPEAEVEKPRANVMPLRARKAIAA